MSPQASSSSFSSFSAAKRNVEKSESQSRSAGLGESLWAWQRNERGLDLPSEGTCAARKASTCACVAGPMSYTGELHE